SYEEPLFNDVGLNYWAKEEVSYLIDRGVISGYADGTFKPNVTLNRVQAAIMLQRALNLDTESVKDPGYQDVPKTYSFYDSIAAVSEAGIMKGKAGGTKFDPYAQLTRAEMAVILQRALKLPEATKNYFTDNHTGSFAYQAVNAMAASNITTGYSDGTYRPANPLTRTEFSVFLYRGLK
ncbi:MAG TPA: S-layer homology domain-containing protein, partial [Chondromyces sp.]|nr:S-layer homology domain-containing protein [Chondromyces sp.]